MSPQWMPQNLQKRLLLYVLQQLSLFSEIDLPNLDVSLGSSSKVTLKDVDLDPDALQIPGAFLRNGRVKNLELQLNMSGGVSIEADGLELTMALASPNSNANSEGSFTEKSKFSLAQSTMGLATSVMNVETEAQEDLESTSDLQTPNQSFHESSVDNDNTSDNNKGPMGNVMTRAVEAALARLQVSLKDISVRLIMDQATVDLVIQNGSFVTNDGERIIELGEISVLTVKPFCEPGDQTELNEENSEVHENIPDSVSTLRPTNEDQCDESENGKEEEEEEEDEEFHDDNISDQGSDDDSDDDGMMSSSILQKPTDLGSSLVYSKEEASSIYMSATSNILEKKHSDDHSTKLCHINKAKIFFSGLSNIKNLKLEVDQINIAATPLPTTLLYVLESLAILNLQDTIKRHSSLNKKFNQLRQPIPVSNINTDDSSKGFDSITISSIIIGLSSALKEDGTFFNPYGLRLVGKEITVTQGDESLMFGGVKSLSALKNKDEPILKFEGDDTKNDLRFESNIKTGDTTILLPKHLNLNMDQESTQKLIDLSSLIPQILDSLTKLSSSKSTKPATASKGSLIFQNSSTNINFRLEEDQSLGLSVSPISYDSSQGSISLKKATITQNNVSLGSLHNLKVDILKTDKQIRSYDNSGHEIVLTCPCFVGIEKIEFEQRASALKQVAQSISQFVDNISFPNEEIRFKGRKKAKISNNLVFQARQAVKTQITIKELNFVVKEILPEFGGISSSLRNISVSLLKDGQVQLHSTSFNVTRIKGLFEEDVISPINIDDKSAPILSLRLRKNKNIHGFLRNTAVEYYTSWISLLNNQSGKDTPSETSSEESSLQASTTNGDSNNCFNITLVECSIGLNPGRLHSKAYLVTKSGNVDVKLSSLIMVKTQVRSAVLVLIDDVKNILTREEAKKFNNITSSRNPSSSWSQASNLNNRGFTSVANINSLHIDTSIKKNQLGLKANGSIIDMNITADNLDIELCADSSQCLTQLLNDLKQPVSINNDLKYKSQAPGELNIFDGVDENAFKPTLDDLILSQDSGVKAPEPLNIVDSYYDGNDNNGDSDIDDQTSVDLSGTNILDKNLDELTIKDKSLSKNPYFTNDSPTSVTHSGNGISSNSSPNIAADGSDKSDSLIMFTDSHFDQSSSDNLKESSKKIEYPMTININVNEISLKIYDGYDWKHTRRTISNTIKKLEKKAAKEKERREHSERRRRSSPSSSIQRNNNNQRASEQDNDEDEEDNDNIVGETLFDSIHVAFPIGSDSSKLTAKINKDLHNKDQEEDVSGASVDNNGIEVGKNNIKKLKLRRSKFHKILIEIHELEANIKIISNNDPISSSTVKNEYDYELLNDIDIKVADFEVIDNVPTSTWNKFVTEMKDTERESGASMLSVNFKTVRPVMSLAATELLMDVNVLPLRLHVDQDTLEILTRFGEFKDIRFNLVDEFEDIVYIQKFQINSVHIKLDYKPKKIDYSGLRSGHTTEFMNFFILDEADMILKKITLYGISGFPKLGKLLNGLWMPDIRSTQLSGVLSGLASVRSLVQIGNGVKGLVVVPMKEYKKDGRIYRSFSKGVEHFTKNTTNELLKFGVKIAAGTQTLLEHTEEVFGGNGAQSRIPRNSRATTSSTRRIRRGNEVIYEEDESDDSIEDDDSLDETDDRNRSKANFGSQLIGRSSLSQTPLQRSIHPSLESFIDLNRESNSQTRRNKRQQRDLVHINGDDFEIEEFHEIGGVGLNEDEDDETQKTISLYADQPTNLKEGFKLAYDSFGRNFLIAKDAILNAGSEIGESGSAHDTTIAVAKATPVALIRPMIGATEAVSKALLGVTNQLDPNQRKYIEDKYKHFKK
ncbi:Autophagy-related protein [Wickerhamomyces ciferrii]|uniref:Autophagy-related protein 2 n=1 Tax=Wickerhamomyces ciferrii (strain ATCC 14091 / BCRC 22168 / CBS 111 / JCM 3599 / NBRC 0793 / NRRL Y-1031 F-60-10) TaxID=1206466 RepID=K0KR16_WICCF|nr:Autophagy-related protein [Wickerhamomyces ciferrii]CCH45571.1 Autophagy-related protein [Wickerhamomyces ciferrii]